MVNWSLWKNDIKMWCQQMNNLSSTKSMNKADILYKLKKSKNMGFQWRDLTTKNSMSQK